MSDSRLPERWRIFDALPEPIRRAIDEHDDNLMVQIVARDWAVARRRMSAFAQRLRKS